MPHTHILHRHRPPGLRAAPGSVPPSSPAGLPSGPPVASVGDDPPPAPEASAGGSTLTADRGWLLSLANQLQRTLDVHELLAGFSQRVREAVPHDSLVFADTTATARVVLGSAAEHSCRYDLVLPDERLGTLTFTRGRPFSAAETVALENVLLNLVYPLRNALRFEEVLKASARDPLTGLGNRANLETTLEREFAAATRHREPLSVILLDVDRFKRVNDREGHLVGDEVLRELAAAVSAGIRECDIAFRYGGDEFVIVLAKTDIAGAALLAERIRARVAAARFATSAGPIRLTVSIGAAMLEPGDDRESLLGRTDAAMYCSKQRGGNRTTTRTREEFLAAAARDDALS